MIQSFLVTVGIFLFAAMVAFTADRLIRVLTNSDKAAAGFLAVLILAAFLAIWADLYNQYTGQG